MRNVSVNGIILWIDFAKTVGILLVVLGHMHIQEKYITVIFAFHMPLFFFVSGYLDKNKSIKETFLKGVKSLLIPYLLLYAISYLCWFSTIFVRRGEISLSNVFLKPLMGLLLGIGQDTNMSTMVAIPLWFLIGLFHVKMLHSILATVSKNNVWLYLLGISLMVCTVYTLAKTNIDLYFSLDSALLAIPFFGMGNIMSRKYHLNALQIPAKIIPAILVGLFCFLMLLILIPVTGYVDINCTLFGKNIVLFYLIGFLGILAVIIPSLCYVKEFKMITIISNGTIIILALHGIVTAIICRIFGVDTVAINPIIAGIVSLVVILAFIPLIIFVKKYVPIIMEGIK
jgi:fucose 4-O-acetylase-like acetyltransferase